MRISQDGTILINTTSTNPASATGFQFTSAGVSFASVNASTSGTNTLHVYSTNATAYRFYVGMNGTINATNTTISAISDQRFKENIRNLDVGLNEILALQPRRFDWKEGKGKNIQNDQGFIAQEFEQVFPEMIGEWLDPAPEGEEPYKSVRADLIPVLVKAIQQQQTMISELQTKVAALKGA
jgi:urocanate hydratase